MIDIEETISLRGYDPLMLSDGSGKRVWAVCNECGDGRWVTYQAYRDLCVKCAANDLQRCRKIVESRTEYKTNPLIDKWFKENAGKHFCGCGCGKVIKLVRNHYNVGIPKYVQGHGGIGKNLSSNHCKSISEGALREKDILPNGLEIDVNSKTVTNKTCSQYLGIFVAEQVLSKIFKDVRVMGRNNHGYDFICNRDFKIDSKSSAIGHKRYWSFLIKKNEIADYFLLLAFDNRVDFNPVYYWLIPGNVINHLTTLTISKSRLDRWSQYEQPIDKVRKCCNKMKGGKI